MCCSLWLNFSSWFFNFSSLNPHQKFPTKIFFSFFLHNRIKNLKHSYNAILVSLMILDSRTQEAIFLFSFSKIDLLVIHLIQFSIIFCFLFLKCISIFHLLNAFMIHKKVFFIFFCQQISSAVAQKFLSLNDYLFLRALLVVSRSQTI